MKQTLSLVAAPTSMQPSKYVRDVYNDATVAATSNLDVEIFRTGKSWEVHTRWACPKPISIVKGHTDRFADALAIIVPTAEDSAWITMGSPEAPVEGVLWRADSDDIQFITAKGLGSSERLPAPAGWRVKSKHANGVYTLMWIFPQWKNLELFKRCAFTVWQGSEFERAGLKSVSAGWVNVDG